MNVTSIRSSESSYRDPRYLSSSTMGIAPPPSKVLVEGYASVLDSIQDEDPRYNPLNQSHPRNSGLLNANDPITMHLLTETAIGDSVYFEVMSFEETEELKKELSFLSNRIEASKRKLALEMKLHEAALSLSRLYDTSNGDHEELATSSRKREELSQELWKLEQRAGEIRRRILEHTAGILQMTHKGLKKKKSTSNQNGTQSYSRTDDFDDRSLYKTADYLDDLDGGYPKRDANNNESASLDLAGLQNAKSKLEELNYRLRDMILLANPNQDVDPIPQHVANGTSPNPITTVNAHLEYLEKGLESVASHQGDSSRDMEGSLHDAEEKLDGFNRQLDNILATSGSSPQLSSRNSMVRRPLSEQLEYLGGVIDEVQKRIGGLYEHKTILTTQIQQQRDLNSKSDAQRDAHIGDLSAEIAQLKKELDISKTEVENTREEMTMVMDQLDAERQESMLREQKSSAEEAKATTFEKELAEKDSHINSLQASLNNLSSERDNEIKDATESKERAEEETNRLQSEYSNIESEMIRIQTELTVAKAELDSAYGSRAERAAEAASNPAIQKEIDQLSEKNMELIEEIAAIKAEQTNKANAGNSEQQQRIQMLEKELRGTIDDYEVMTKASIGFEKERDRFESIIDSYRDRCDNLESQLNDERIQILGASQGAPTGNTSTTVLRNEFKKMMRDTRAENMKALRAEQEERRRLETLVRTLKKEQSAGKSNLSQSTTAS